MTHTLLILLASVLAETPMMETPKYLYTIYDNGTAEVWECFDWEVFCDGKWARFRSTKLSMTHDEFLVYFTSREELCNLVTLGALAEKWRSTIPVPDPPAEVSPPMGPPPVVIYYVRSLLSDKYHLPNCRYANAKMVRVTPEDVEMMFYTACSVCKPMDFESIVKCFIGDLVQ